MRVCVCVAHEFYSFKNIKVVVQIYLVSFSLVKNRDSSGSFLIKSREFENNMLFTYIIRVAFKFKTIL